MKHIILPTDFSDNALNASRYALKLFEKERCTFHIVNCYTPGKLNLSISTAVLKGTVTDNFNRINSEQDLLVFMNKLKVGDFKPWHFCKTISSPNLLTNEIKDLIERFNVELVVMGTKGATGLREIFMGSSTVQVIKAIKSCPVLAIPESFNFLEPLEIAFATDLFRFYSKSELQPVINLARTFKSTIRIVNVNEDENPLSDIQKFNLNTIQKHFGNITNQLHSVSFSNSISRTLELFTQELDVHLLALLNYPHTYLDKVTREPVVQKIGFHTRIPLLVIPEISMGSYLVKRKNKEKVFVE